MDPNRTQNTDVFSRTGINTHNPELAEIPLPCFTIAIGKFPPALNRFTRSTVELSTSSAIPLRMV
jgi:hypothetical protein